ncbi:MAG: hypothetical protein HYX67_14320 [Candidatus Melainabacteria bacterium]|nr:hypothetical protein [Candidatus Melainabacteria bacterium]
MASILSAARMFSQKLSFFGNDSKPALKSPSPLEMQKITLNTELLISNFEKGVGEVLSRKKSIVDFDPAGIVEGLVLLRKVSPDKAKHLGDRVNAVYLKLSESNNSRKAPQIQQSNPSSQKEAAPISSSLVPSDEILVAATQEEPQEEAPSLEQQIEELTATIKEQMEIAEKQSGNLDSDFLTNLESLVQQRRDLKLQKIESLKADIAEWTKALEERLAILEQNQLNVTEENNKYIKELFSGIKSMKGELQALEGQK